MLKASPLLRFAALAAAAFAIALTGIDGAIAQTRNCQTLINTLNSIERNGDFRRLQQTTRDARDLQDAVQDAESDYVRSGCNAAAKRGDPQTSECRRLARKVLSARDDFAEIQRSLETGNAVAQQREAVLQEIARFNCDSQSSAGVTQQQPERRMSLFDRLFGGFDGGGGTRGDEFAGYAGYETVRTVCVRKVDGYYWPISYSTLIDYVPNDLPQCKEQCPGQDVDLYYYDNPGQEPEQMRTLSGEAYTSLPAAFAYRTAYDPANSCKVNTTYGSIALVTISDGVNRPMITIGETTFPLPLSDPRQTQTVTTVVDTATYVDVPLPRPRPPAPGETPGPVVLQTATTDPVRIVMFGDKRVRIVGPDTPYAPTGAAGT